MAMVPGPVVGVVVDSGLHLAGRPRLLAVPVGVRLPAGVQIVGYLSSGAMGVAAECPARGRRSVRAAATGNGGVLPDYTMGSGGLFFGSAAGSGALAGAIAVADECPSGVRRSVRAAAAGKGGVPQADADYTMSSGPGLFFRSAASSGATFLFGSAGSGVAPAAAAGRSSQSHGVVVVAATAGSPADGGGFDDEDATHEIVEEEKQIKKEEWMEGWNTEKAQQDIEYPEWLVLHMEGASMEETPTVTDMFTKEHVLQLITDFHPEDVVSETFLDKCANKYQQRTGSQSYIADAYVVKQEKYKDSEPTTIYLFKEFHCSKTKDVTKHMRKVVDDIHNILEATNC